VAGKPLSSYLLFQGERAQDMGHGIEALPYGEFLLERLPAHGGIA
jgi:hypothetical protein